MTYKLGPVRTFGKGVYEVTVDGRGDASGDSSPSMSPLGSVRTHSSSNSNTETMSESAPLPPIVRQHDILNLILIMGLNILNVCFLAGWSDGSLLKHCSVAYFLADMLFVAGWPQVVKSPGVILGHHTVSLGLIAIPYLYPQPFTMNGLAYCMLVEINTWFLISKRTIPYAKALQEALFYASWVILRLMWYPYLCYSFTQEWLSRWEATGTPWNAILIAPIFQVFLTSLNVQWTLALLLKKKKGPRAKQL